MLCLVDSDFPCTFEIGYFGLDFYVPDEPYPARRNSVPLVCACIFWCRPRNRDAFNQSGRRRLLGEHYFDCVGRAPATKIFSVGFLLILLVVPYDQNLSQAYKLMKGGTRRA